jgi:hypothetical protein
MNRKPDFENESFRMWRTTEKEKQEIEERDITNEISVKFGDIELVLNGFHLVKENNKLIWAYKVKSDNKNGVVNFIHHIFEDANAIQRERIHKTIEDMTEHFPFDFSISTIEEVHQRILNEKHVIDKLTEKEKK